jgi:glycine reductase
VDIARSVGASRILRGFAITCPVGNPNFDIKDEKAYRHKYMKKALHMLEQPGEQAHVEDLG